MLVESLSGIRGIYNRDLTLEVARKYAVAYYACMKKPRKIVIGTDGRPSAKALRDAMVLVLPCDIHDLGTLPTPAIQHSIKKLKADGGIIITASHNEPYWNGFKFLGKDGSVLKPKDMEKVISQYQGMTERMFSLHLKRHSKMLVQRKIEDRSQEAKKAYTEHIVRALGPATIRKLKQAKLSVVLDPNGGAGTQTADILERAGLTVHGINMQEGIFTRKVEPTQESLLYLTTFIREMKASFGAGFDADADRVEIILEDGTMISGNHLLAAAVKQQLSSSKSPQKEHVVVNNATSSIVRDVVEEAGANFHEVEVGEANVVEAMEKHKSSIGGEGSSSGVILAPGKCRDGILGLLLFAAIAAEYKKKRKQLKDIILDLPTYYNLREKVDIRDTTPNKIMQAIKRHYKGRDLRENDSIKVFLSDKSFVWFRVSRTEGQVLRIIADAPLEQEAQDILDEAKTVVEAALPQKVTV